MQELLNSVGKPFPTAQFSITLGCKSPHRRGPNSSYEEKTYSPQKVQVRKVFYFLLTQFDKPGLDSGQRVEC